MALKKKTTYVTMQQNTAILIYGLNTMDRSLESYLKKLHSHLISTVFNLHENLRLVQELRATL